MEKQTLTSIHLYCQRFANRYRFMKTSNNKKHMPQRGIPGMTRLISDKLYSTDN